MRESKRFLGHEFLPFASPRMEYVLANVENREVVYAVASRLASVFSAGEHPDNGRYFRGTLRPSDLARVTARPTDQVRP